MKSGVNIHCEWFFYNNRLIGNKVKIIFQALFDKSNTILLLTVFCVSNLFNHIKIIALKSLINLASIKAHTCVQGYLDLNSLRWGFENNTDLKE